MADVDVGDFCETGDFFVHNRHFYCDCAFNKAVVKPSVVVLGDNAALNEDRYIHGNFGNGFWTFLGGHDPEDYRHFIGDPPTDLSLYPNSPGYRLILNNILFTAEKKEKHKT